MIASPLSESPIKTYSAEPLPRVELLNITPELAARWLAECNTHNRRISMPYVQRIAADIRAGCWLQTHAGIAFSPNNVLLDGQHRLTAIVLADMPVQMYVWFNVSPKALMAIDNNKPRRQADILNLGGSCDRVDDRQLAVLRTMYAKRGSRNMSAGATQAALDRHREAIAFALTQLPANTPLAGIATCTTRAVVARAWYSSQRQRVADFCKVLTTGMTVHVDDRPAQMLFQYLIRPHGSSRAEMNERYGKTERALQAFLRNEPLAKLCAASEELFPLPEEAKA